MKTIQFVSTLLIAFLTSSAQAELAWVSTKFWKAPTPASLSFKLIPVSKDLPLVCQDYRETIVNRKGGTNFDRDELDTLRQQSESISSRTYFANFTIQRDTLLNEAAKVLPALNALAARSSSGPNPLPNFVQETTEVSLPFQVTENLKVQFSPRSLLQISESVGLEPLQIQVIESPKEVLVRVYGKDAVCDLVESNATISLTTRAVVKISFDRQQELIQIYTRFQELVDQTFEKKKSPLGRSALFGLSVGNYFSTLERNDAVVESWLTNSVEGFFDDKMEKNQFWGTLGGKKFLTVHGAAQTNLNITFSR